MKRPWPITDEQEWRRSCKEIVDVSRRILDGTMGTVEGARSLVTLRLRLKAEDDPDFLVFVAIDYQSDHFPLGDVRRRWSSVALALQDACRNRFEEGCKQDAKTACHNLISKYDNAT